MNTKPPLKQAREIDTLIRARYPILYLVTWEEERIEEIVAQLGKDRGKKVYTWSFTLGLQPYGTSIQSQKNKQTSSKDPLIALDSLIENVEPSIYILRDFHPFLAKNNFAIIRKLRDIARELRNSLKTICIISPMLQIPFELEKDVTVVDCDLPDLGSLDCLLSQILAELNQAHNMKIQIPPGEKEHLLQAALGLTLKEAENVFAKIIVENGTLTGAHVQTVFSEKQQIIRKTGVLDYYHQVEDFDHVGGLDILKEWLKRRGGAFSQKARDFGLPEPKGALLIGVQGCGKSLSAKAVASCWKFPLLRLDVGKMFGSLVGSSEENMRKAIKIAESIAPTILWVDEIDKAFAGADSSSSDGGTTARVLGTFLTWLQEKESPVFVIATANNISHLPPELLRKGRLDEIFFVDLPCEMERETIFKIHLNRRGRDPQKFNLKLLSQKTEGFSGAEIEQLVISALYNAFHIGEDIKDEDILSAIESTVPLSKTMKENLDALREWAKDRACPASSSSSNLNLIPSPLAGEG